jgi:muramoyltetrapeptide carboxypeptidase LdcA involved in peptidoglycan recycling
VGEHVTEDCLSNSAVIERSFSMLKVSGVLDRIGGIILGKHELFDDLKTNKKPYEILLEVLNGTKIPFIAEFDCAHTHPMLSIPIGCEVELDATNKTIRILEEF